MKTSTFMKEQYKKKGIEKILYFDLETMVQPRFNARYGMLLNYHAEIRNVQTNKIEHFYDYRFPENLKNKDVKTLRNFKNDKPLIQQLAYLINESDMIVGHNLKWFDYAYFKTRCQVLNMPHLIPQSKTVKVADTWKMAKYSLKLLSNSLDNVADALLGQSDKTKFNPMIWLAIYDGNQEAMDYSIDHCKKDVAMTRKIHMKMEDSLSIPTSYL